MREQLCRADLGREYVTVFDGVAQLGMEVILLLAVTAGPPPVVLLDRPQEPSHLRTLDSWATARLGPNVPTLD